MISAKMDDTKPPSKTDVPDVTEKEIIEKELPIIDEDYDQDVQNTEAAHSEEASDVDKLRDDKEAKSKEMDKDVKPQEPKRQQGAGVRVESGSREGGREEQERQRGSGQGKDEEAEEEPEGEEALSSTRGNTVGTGSEPTRTSGAWEQQHWQHSAQGEEEEGGEMGKWYMMCTHTSCCGQQLHFRQLFIVKRLQEPLHGI